MKHSYFRSGQSDQFAFYRIPKVLFTDEQYKSISTDAKVLYGLLLDRMSLSQKNGWSDSEGRVFIVFTVEEITTALGCASQKAVKLLTELETSAELIERKRQGLGKPNLIYVLNFSDSSESQFQNGENHNSGMMKIKTPEFPKSQCNNTDSNNTELSDTDCLAKIHSLDFGSIHRALAFRHSATPCIALVAALFLSAHSHSGLMLLFSACPHRFLCPARKECYCRYAAYCCRNQPPTISGRGFHLAALP